MAPRVRHRCWRPCVRYDLAPNSAARTTGVVRAAVEAWWNDLKRGHFIDLRTRLIQITFPLRNNNCTPTPALTERDPAARDPPHATCRPPTRLSCCAAALLSR